MTDDSGVVRRVPNPGNLLTSPPVTIPCPPTLLAVPVEWHAYRICEPRFRRLAGPIPLGAVAKPLRMSTASAPGTPAHHTLLRVLSGMPCSARPALAHPARCALPVCPAYVPCVCALRSAAAYVWPVLRRRGGPPICGRFCVAARPYAAGSAPAWRPCVAPRSMHGGPCVAALRGAAATPFRARADEPTECGRDARTARRTHSAAHAQRAQRVGVC